MQAHQKTRKRPNPHSFRFIGGIEDTLLALSANPANRAAMVYVIQEKFKYDILFKLSAQHPSLEESLKCDALQNYWLEQLKIYGEEMGFVLKPQHGIAPYDQVRGLYLFHKALKLRNNSELKSESYPPEEAILLAQADQLGCYSASREIQYAHIQKLKLFSADLPIESYIEHAEKIATMHLTPGRVFAAEYFIHLANYFFHHKNIIDQERMVMRAIYHLIMAKNLEAISADYIHNAYFGATLSEAFKKGFATSIKLNSSFESWDILIEGLIKTFNLENRLAQAVKHIANNDAKAIITEEKKERHKSSIFQGNKTP